MFLGFLYNPVKQASEFASLPKHLRDVRQPDTARGREALLNLMDTIRRSRRGGNEPWAREKAAGILHRVNLWRANTKAPGILPPGVELLERYTDWLEDKPPGRRPRTLDEAGPGTGSWKWFVRQELEEHVGEPLPDGMSS